MIMSRVALSFFLNAQLETLFFTNLLEVSTGRYFGALKGLKVSAWGAG